jgi:hypothetical protein
MNFKVYFCSFIAEWLHKRFPEEILEILDLNVEILAERLNKIYQELEVY